MHLIVEEEEVVVTLEDVERKNVIAGIVDHRILQCSKTVLKGREKNDTHVTFDDENALLSLTSNLQMSTFTQDSNELYF